VKKLVVSGINLFEGGPLSIFYDCLDAIMELKLTNHFEVVAFVHKKELFAKYSDNIELIELPKSRKSYINRLYYEYFYFYNYSKKHEIDVWLSLHDMTPRVNARKIYTYCHNVSPFIPKDIRNIKYSITDVVFSYLYQYVYRINIKHATALIVQTEWMRDAFKKMYPVNDIIVARPSILDEVQKEKLIASNDNKKITTFIYPVFPRVFKNYEVLCEAARGLDADKCEVLITIDGTENSYAKDIHERYKDVRAIKWIGLIPRNKVFDLYQCADCLVFSSRMETWGLPISEFKLFNKDIILVDLPYARETLGEYKKVMFFKENDSTTLRELMNDVIDSRQKYTPCERRVNMEPFADSWSKLLGMIIE